MAGASAHETGRPTAHVSLPVHQELIQEVEGHALAVPGHVAVVLLEEPQVGADALEIFLAFCLLQQLLEGGVCAEGVHEPQAVVEGKVPQAGDGLLPGTQGGSFWGHRQRLLHRHVSRDAPGGQEALKVPEFGVDCGIPAVLFRGHVGQLGQNDGIGVCQGIDLGVLLPGFIPQSPDPEIGVDQQKGLNGQVLKLQVPGGVVGGYVGDVGQILLRKVLPGEVIVQVGSPWSILAPAAEFSNVVAERGGAHQGNVYLQPSLSGQLRGVHRHIVHPDGMTGRIKGHAVPANAQEGGKAVPEDRLAKDGVFLA